MHIELIETFLPMQHFVNEQIAEAGGAAVFFLFSIVELN